MSEYLYDVDHPYYCESGSYWNGQNDYHHEYESAEIFLEDFGKSDPDLNLVFRFDWGGLGSPSCEELDENKTSTFRVWWIVQRKGFMASAEFPVTKSDEPMLREWLETRWNKMVEIWNPISKV